MKTLIIKTKKRIIPIRKFTTLIKHYLGKLKAFYTSALLLSLGLLSPAAFADNSQPFSGFTFNLSNNEDIVDALGTEGEKALRYVLILIGVILIVMAINTLMNTLRDDSKERQHGSIYSNLISVALYLFFGIGIISIGWTATNTAVS